MGYKCQDNRDPCVSHGRKIGNTRHNKMQCGRLTEKYLTSFADCIPVCPEKICWPPRLRSNNSSKACPEHTRIRIHPLDWRYPNLDPKGDMGRSYRDLGNIPTRAVQWEPGDDGVKPTKGQPGVKPGWLLIRRATTSLNATSHFATHRRQNYF
jgi:hypothetical protein